MAVSISTGIPKIIHYCWFGGAPLPPLAQKCIASWEKYLKWYEIKRWDENNFDFHCCPYVEEAYYAQKWAFITDYVRLYVLDKYGGIYMDTDVEVLKPLDRFLSHHAFSGFEDNHHIPTGIMGAEKNNPWISYLLSYYDNRRFILPDGSYDMTTNVVVITNMTKSKYFLKCDNTYQNLCNDVVIYPKDFFCPKDCSTNKLLITNNTHAIHHFSGSWVDPYSRLRGKTYQMLYRMFGQGVADSVRNLLRRRSR